MSLDFSEKEEYIRPIFTKEQNEMNPKEKEDRLAAVHHARQVEHLISKPQIIELLNVAERYAHGQATKEELERVRKNAKRSNFADYAAYAACVGDALAARIYATA